MICRKHYTILTGEKATETFEEEAGLRGFETDKSEVVEVIINEKYLR